MSLNFNDVFGDAPLDMDCPKCKKKISITLNQVGSKITCPSCKSIIELQKDNDFENSKRSADNALKDLDKAFKNFGK